MNDKKTYQLKILGILAAMVLMATGCTTIYPAKITGPADLTTEGEIFSHEEWDRVLGTHVDDQGKIDYTALHAAPSDIRVYYQKVATYSPDSHPRLFPSDDHRLAYWINAYNAGAITIVLDHYPIESVLDVKNPLVLFFLTDKAGFFFFHRLAFGGKTTSLYYLENSVIRKRFKDPRIHFALNCASIGCPRLPMKAFSGELLDQQLDAEARRFLKESRNFRIDHAEKRIHISSIFKWFEDDFHDWLKQHFPEKDAALLNYIGLYLDREQADELAKVQNQYAVTFIPYDWGLNDQKTAWN